MELRLTQVNIIQLQIQNSVIMWERKMITTLENAYQTVNILGDNLNSRTICQFLELNLLQFRDVIFFLNFPDQPLIFGTIFESQQIF